MAASGNPTTVGRDTGPYSTNNLRNRSAQSRSIQRIRRTSGLGPVNRGRATAFQLATGSTNQPTAVKHGRIPVWKSPSALQRLQSAQRTATRSLPRCRVRSGAIRRIAGFTKRPTAAKRGAKFSKDKIFRPAALMSPLIRKIRTSCSRRCGISGAKGGSTVQVAKVLRRHPAVGYFGLQTAATLGRRLRRRPIKVSR